MQGPGLHPGTEWMLWKEADLKDNEAAYVVGADFAQAQRPLLGRGLHHHVKAPDQLRWQIGAGAAHLLPRPRSAP